MLLMTILLLILILIRVPIAFAILFSGIIGLLVLDGPAGLFGVLATIPQSAASKESLAAIPLFILMAQFILHSGALNDLFASARVIVGRIRGGTAVAAVGAGAVFASVSGSSTAAAATLAHTSTGKLIEEGYSPRFSSGVVAAAGTLAAMIPPSILLVFYAITAETGVGPTLMAGLIPGLLVVLALVITVLIVVRVEHKKPPKDSESTEKMSLLRAFQGVVPIAAIFAVVVGFVFFGVTTATEAAAIGVISGVVLMMLRKRLTWSAVRESMAEAVSSSVMILAIIMAAHVFGHLITETQVTPQIMEAVSNLPVSPIIIVALIAMGYLVLGFFMDQMAIIALTVPVTLPIVEALGFDPIWFGIVVILLAEVGLITPPLGLNVFVTAKAARLPVEVVFRGSIPFVFAILAVGIILFVFPDIVLFLPSLM